MPRLINDPDGFNDAGDCILIREDAMHVRGDCFACDAEADRRAYVERNETHALPFDCPRCGWAITGLCLDGKTPCDECPTDPSCHVCAWPFVREV